MLKEKSKPILENSVDEIKATLEEYEGTVEEVEAEEKAFNVELISQLDEITAKDERGALEHAMAHYDYIQLVDKIQDLVDEYDTDKDED